MEKDFDKWNVIKKTTDSRDDSPAIKVGEIRWCRFGKGKSFQRPVLILKKYSKDIFLGLPLTSKIRTGTWFYPLQKNPYGCVLLNQSKTLDRKRLEEKICEIPDIELNLIKEAYINLLLNP